MNRSFIGITIDIIDYYPIDYDYNSFCFIFISENKEFEHEISYINRNQIYQKMLINKKDIKFSIKVTKNDALIGISELIIPIQIINKKEQIYDKICPITVSNSIKKVLFGSVSNSIPLKIGIHIILQYLGNNINIEKNNKKEKVMFKQRKKKDNKEESYTPKKLISKDKTSDTIKNSNSGVNNKINSININLFNSSINRFTKKGESFISNFNNKPLFMKERACSTHRQKQKSPKIKSMKNTFKDKEIEKDIKTEENIEDKKNNYSIRKNIFNEINIATDDNSNNNYENSNNNYDKLLNQKNDNEDIIDLNNNMNDYIDKNLNIQINNIKEINEMNKYTNDNLKNLLNYQIKYYDFIKKEVDLGNKYNELVLDYNEKYRTTLMRINKLKEEKNYNQIKKEILLSNEKLYNNSELIKMKNKEFNIINEISSKINVIKTKNNKEYIDKNGQFLLLFKVLKKINNKFGPIQKLLNQSNSTETQRINLRNIINKYPKELDIKENIDIAKNNNINKKTIDKFDYISTKNPDDIDIKIEYFLKRFYSKHQLPKIIFKKTSRNNYEYGTQKIMIKLEGEALRVRYSAGYLLLDKFVEQNAILEEKRKEKYKNKFTKQ